MNTEFLLRGDTLANIRIDNLSSDTVTVFLDGQDVIIEEDGRFTFESLEKGGYTLRIHRTRVPYESGSADKNDKDTSLPFGGEEKSLYTPLDYIAQIYLNSSKAVLTIKNDITSAEGKGLDAVFASYSVTPTGAKVEKERKIFSSTKIRQAFISHHIKNMFFPTGICSLAVFITGIVSLIFAINDKPIDIGGTKFTLPWAVALIAIAAVFVTYSVYCIFRIFKKVKELKE